MDPTFELTTPWGLYKLLLGLTIVVELVFGAIEAAMYVGVLPY